MQVGHGFARVGTIVDDESKPISQIKLLRHRFGGEHKVAKDRAILIFGSVHALYRLLGNDQDVGRRLRLDIPDRDAEIILVLDRRRNFAVDDFLEDRFHQLSDGLFRRFLKKENRQEGTRIGILRSGKAKLRDGFGMFPDSVSLCPGGATPAAQRLFAGNVGDHHRGLAAGGVSPHCCHELGACEKRTGGRGR